MKYDNYLSDNNINVSSGVPQGDQLSPLLFSIFINDMTKMFKYSNKMLLADDTKLLKKNLILNKAK